MTTSNELRALLERVEGGSGRDFDLDCRLAWIFGLEPWSGAPEYHVGLCMPGSKTGKATPALTSSIDAAAALVEKVLPGWDHGYNTGDGIAFGTVWRAGYLDDTAQRGIASTPSRSILAALLRAKLAQEDGNA